MARLASEGKTPSGFNRDAYSTFPPPPLRSACRSDKRRANLVEQVSPISNPRTTSHPRSRAARFELQGLPGYYFRLRLVEMQRPSAGIQILDRAGSALFVPSSVSKKYIVLHSILNGARNRYTKLPNVSMRPL